MNLNDRVMAEMKTAIKAKDKASLRGLRAIKSAILLAQTDGSGKEIDDAREIEILQKLIKQRQDSLSIYEQQNREDLAVVEREEIEVIQKFLPKQMNDAELEAALKNIIDQAGASSMKDMGKVMGLASNELKGKADNRKISSFVKKLLS